MGLSISRKLQVAFSGFMGLGFIALSIITLVPAEASKLNRLGYSSVCSFTPLSTGILMVFSIISLWVAWRRYKN